MIGKALIISTIMYTLYANTRTPYPMYRYSGLSNGGGMEGVQEARKKNRRNKIIRRRQSR